MAFYSLCLAVLTLCALLLAVPVGAAATPGSKQAANRQTANKQAHRPPSGLSARKKTAQRRLASIRREIVQKQAVLRDTKRAQRKVSEEIQENETELGEARARLTRARSRLKRAESELADAKRRLAAAQTRLSGYTRLLRGRLVDVYKHGSVSYAAVLIQARDTWDLTSRGHLLRRVVRHDVGLLESIRAEKAEIEAQTQRLQDRRNEVARLRTEEEREVKVVASRLAEQRQIQEDLRRDRARLEAALAELEQNSREVEQMLRVFEARPDIARRIPRPWTGSFLRPVAGRITSGFGMRFHPILRVRRMHTGVDLAAPAGTPIKAAGDGVVVHAGWWGGYGKCVVIAHGNGRSTLYGHCSSIAVSVGQRVRRGQVIGRVGSTGFSTGPHLHFEVRVHGVPVNPLSH